MNGMANLDPQQLEQLKQVEEMKKKILSGILTKEAYERLSRVKSVNEGLANQVELYLIQLFQGGKIQGQVTDQKMKELLGALSGKRDFNIRRK